MKIREPIISVGCSRVHKNEPYWNSECYLLCELIQIVLCTKFCGAPHQLRAMRSDLVQRLQANKCELCGSQGDCEVHHVRKLVDLKKRWARRPIKPE